MSFILRSNTILIIKTLLYLIIVSLIFGFISQLALKLLNINLIYPNLKTHLYKNGIYFTIFSYAIITPLLEELSFRLWLKYSKTNIYISLISTILLLLKSNLSSNICLFILIATFTIAIILEFNNIQPSFFWHKHSKIIFLFSCLLFEICHVFNFKTNNTILLLSPIITLQQLSLGVILANTRIKNGIFYSILCHSLYNSLVILIEFME